MTKRCTWCGTDPLYVAYHDSEWGVPTLDDASLFEMLVLEGAQAGLAWITVLRKREGYRELFDGFDASRIARYTDRKLDKLLEVHLPEFLHGSRFPGLHFSNPLRDGFFGPHR